MTATTAPPVPITPAQAIAELRGLLARAPTIDLARAAMLAIDALDAAKWTREPNLATTLVRELEAAAEQRSGVVARVNGADLHAEAAELRAEVDRLAKACVEWETLIVRTNAMQREQDAASVRRSAEWGSTFEAQRDEIGRLAGELEHMRLLAGARIGELSAEVTTLRRERDALREMRRECADDYASDVDHLTAEQERVRALCEAFDRFDGLLEEEAGLSEAACDAFDDMLDARNALRTAGKEAAAPKVERAHDELPPGWAVPPRGVHPRPSGTLRYNGEPYIEVRNDKHEGWRWWRARQSTCPDGVPSMHEAMRLARGLATIDELWTAPPAKEQEP